MKDTLDADIRRLLRTDEREDKRAKLRKRVVEYVCAVPIGATRLERLVAVASQLERRYWADKTTKPLSEQLLADLSARLFERDEIRFFLDAYIEDMLLQLKLGGESLMLFRGTGSAEQLRLAALHWFVLRFYATAGESLERSIRFGLLLLEEFAGMSQALMGLSLAQALQRQESRISFGVFLIIQQTAGAPPHKESWNKQWLYRLIENAENDQTAALVLSSVMSVFVMLRPDNWYEHGAVAEDLATAAQLTRQQFASPLEAQALAPKLLLDKDHHRRFDRWRSAEEGAGAKERKRCEVVLARFRSRRDELGAAFDRRCREILENPRRGLRPFGVDHVEIAVSPLRFAGIRSAAFHPEGQEFPDAALDVIVRKESPRLLVFKGQLARLELELDDEALYNAFLPELDELRAVLEFVLVDVLHRIVTGVRPLPGEKVRREPGEAVTERPRTVAVRPFIRRLPTGTKATERAQQLAAETFGWKLPTGVTFVSAHYRRGELHYDLPTQPIASYTDDDLFDL